MTTFNNNIPELTLLLTRVEELFGKRVSTPYDFEALSIDILDKTGKGISTSTLKRLWGYVSMNNSPRNSTLDILCEYVGCKDYVTYCNELRNNTSFTSRFFTSDCMNTTTLTPGRLVTISWIPDRVVKMKYLGSQKFRIVEQRNSKLEVGDEFEISHIMLNFPLIIPRILRNGEYTASYVAGRQGGINSINIE